jgi:hypothetical protein
VSTIDRDDKVVNLAISACPKPNEYFGQSNATIFCKGFINRYVNATAKNTK